jgi:hypothetical protein
MRSMYATAHARTNARTDATPARSVRNSAPPATQFVQPSRFAHDFSRIPVHSREAEEQGPEKRREKTGPMSVDEEPRPEVAPAQTPIPQQALPPPQPGSLPQQGPLLPQAPPPLGTVTATVPASIRAASTQAGMPDRIPPRVDTPVDVDVAGWIIPMLDVTFSIAGNGGNNGSVTINGARSVDLNAAATLQLRGVNQTKPGNAGNLSLIAKQGSAELARSSGFSVSSVPQNWSTSLVNAVDEPDQIGMVALNSWESDSGNVADLDEVKRREQVDVKTKTGPWAGARQGTSTWKDATMGSIEDHHIDSPRSAFRATGKKIANQVFTFKCERTAVVDIVARNSGLLISREVKAGATAGAFNYTISKVGTAVTANGFSSDAANGSAAPPSLVV